ncbi:TDP-N-acetylfucosamine:lipid II N-acetylfucosaminyltransferase [Shigella flexneri]
MKPSQFFSASGGQTCTELSSGLTDKLFYPLRRLGEKPVGCDFATRGDLAFLPSCTGKAGELLYFPTRIYLLTIPWRLIGNVKEK